MTTLFATLDQTVETLLINTLGMPQRSTDFVMIGLGTGILIGLVLIVIGLILLYGTLMLKAYFNMVYQKDRRLRRNWSVIFISELVILIVVIMTLIN